REASYKNTGAAGERHQLSEPSLDGWMLYCYAPPEGVSMRGVKSIASAVLVLGGGVLLVGCGSRGPSSGAGNGSPLKTVWGEPDLQGIWTLETDTPLQ